MLWRAVDEVGFADRSCTARKKPCSAGEPGFGIGQQVVELADLGFVGIEFGRARLRVEQLLVHELVVLAQGGRDLGAGAEKPAAAEERLLRFLHGALARVAGSAGIRDVVAGRDQPACAALSPDNPIVSTLICVFLCLVYGKA